jgi:hypothetical protein
MTRAAQARGQVPSTTARASSNHALRISAELVTIGVKGA